MNECRVVDRRSLQSIARRESPDAPPSSSASDAAPTKVFSGDPLLHHGGQLGAVTHGRRQDPPNSNPINQPAAPNNTISSALPTAGNPDLPGGSNNDSAVVYDPYGLKEGKGDGVAPNNEDLADVDSPNELDDVITTPIPAPTSVPAAPSLAPNSSDLSDSVGGSNNATNSTADDDISPAVQDRLDHLSNKLSLFIPGWFRRSLGLDKREECVQLYRRVPIIY